MKANDFIPDWGNKIPRSVSQLQYQQELELHKMVLDLPFADRDKLVNALKASATNAAELFFEIEPAESSLIGFNGCSVNVTGDLDVFFTSALNGMKITLDENYNRLVADRKLSIYVKADSALFAAFKVYFKESLKSTGIKFKGENVSPRESSDVNINHLIKKAAEYFDNFLKTRDR